MGSQCRLRELHVRFCIERALIQRSITQACTMQRGVALARVRCRLLHIAVEQFQKHVHVLKHAVWHVAQVQGAGAARGGDRGGHRGHHQQVVSLVTYGVRHTAQVQGARMLREEVTRADIADTISKWTL